MNYKGKINISKSIIRLSEQCIENEKLIEELLVKIEQCDPVKIVQSTISDNSFDGANLLHELIIYRNRLNRDKFEISRLEGELFNTYAI